MDYAGIILGSYKNLIGGTGWPNLVVNVTPIVAAYSVLLSIVNATIIGWCRMYLLHTS